MYAKDEAECLVQGKFSINREAMDERCRLCLPLEKGRWEFREINSGDSSS